MQIQTTSTSSTQWDEWWQGNGVQGNANDSECKWRQMGGDVNKGGQAMVGVELACGSSSIGSSYTAATITALDTGTYYPKTSPPAFHWPKSSPHSMVFGFLAPITPPLCTTKLHPPATSHLMYPTPIGSSWPKNQPTCSSIFGPNHPPSHATGLQLLWIWYIPLFLTYLSLYYSSDIFSPVICWD